MWTAKAIRGPNVYETAEALEKIPRSSRPAIDCRRKAFPATLTVGKQTRNFEDLFSRHRHPSPPLPTPLPTLSPPHTPLTFSFPVKSKFRTPSCPIRIFTRQLKKKMYSFFTSKISIEDFDY